MENDEKVVFKLIPKYNFIYELFMPTGKRTSKLICNFFILLLIYLGVIILNNIFKISIPTEFDATLKILNIIYIIIIVALAIAIIVYVALQVYQYKNTIFTFYDTYMTYEDNFLNQHKKTIQYLNVREVEIRKNVWDRINGYGVIVIYTNADNEFNNGLVIFGIKDPDMWYNKIDSLVHNVTEKFMGSKNEINVNMNNQNNLKNTSNVVNSQENVQNDDNSFIESNNNSDNVITQKEKEFKDSLNNVKH